MAEVLDCYALELTALDAEKVLVHGEVIKKLSSSRYASQVRLLELTVFEDLNFCPFEK